MQALYRRTFNGFAAECGEIAFQRFQASTREESVLKLGELEAKLQQRRQVPEWIGGVALGAGLVLVLVGLKKR